MEREIAESMKMDQKYKSVPHGKSGRDTRPHCDEFGNAMAKSANHTEDIETDLPNILRLFRQQLHIFVEEQNESTMKRGDFERMGNLANPSEPFDQADNKFGEDEDQLQTEGRKSYMKIKTRKNWPPNLEDLLEYISIYSQMNNIKFTSLNYEEFFEKKTKKHKKKGSNLSKQWNASKTPKVRGDGDVGTFRKESSRDTKNLTRSKNISMKTQESMPENQDVKLLQDLIDSVSLVEVLDSDERRSNTAREIEYKFRFSFDQFYQVLFESSCRDHEGVKFLDSDNYEQNEMLRAIIRSMNFKITSRNEDVMQTIDVLEYFVKMLTELPNKELTRYTLELLNEILKGDFILQGEKPFKSFYCVIFYLCNGFKQLESILWEMWLPMEIQISGKRQRSNVGVNNTTSYQPEKMILQSNIYDHQAKESTREIEKDKDMDEHKMK